MTTQNQDNITYIPHNKLILSTINVRQAESSKQTDSELEASIEANSVLQNLIVARVPNRNVYEVGGGGRRWRLTGKLIKRGVFPEDYLMPVKEVPYEHLKDCSMAENWGREPMHPADGFTAISSLIKAGRSLEEVSAQFGLRLKTVQLLLRLSQVAPKIVSAFRANKID